MELWFLFSAHRLMMVYICTKFHENILNGIRVMERTRKVNGRTDRRKARHNTTCLRQGYKNDNCKLKQLAIITDLNKKKIFFSNVVFFSDSDQF